MRGSGGRARAIPLATLVCVVAVLVVLRARERGHLRGLGSHEPASPPPQGDAAVQSIARPPPPGGGQTSLDAGASLAPHMIHGDPRHTARAAVAGPTRANLAWTSHVGGAIEAQVVASFDERTLYVASLDGSLTALAARDGARSWTLPLGDRVYSTPCVAPGGTIYVGSDAKRFYAVTPQGAVLWKLETSGEADTGAVMVGDLVVFAAGSSVYAVRPGGDLAWRFEVKRKIFTAPAVGIDGRIVVGAQDHHVYALSPAGALAWTVDLGADVDGAPAIADDGAIYVGTDAGEVARISPSGELAWRTHVGGFVRGTLSVGRNGDALAGVYGPTPHLVRVAGDGRITGTSPIQGTGAPELGVHGGPLEDATGALFFGAQDDDVHAVGPGGLWQWRYTTGGDVDAPLTLLSSGALVAASDDGNVYLFAP